MRKKINSNFIELTPDNLRGFTLTTNSEDIYVKRDNQYNIISVIIEDTYRLKLGDSIKLDNFNYTVNTITQVGNTFYGIESSITKTSQFIFPLLGKNFAFYDLKANMYNTYISKNYEFIYLVYKFSSTEDYLALEGKLQSHNCFVEILDPNPDFVVMEFKIPDKYWEDVCLIMGGKYKDIKEATKIVIYKFHGLSSHSKTFKTLFNSDRYREYMEDSLGCIIPEELSLMSKPNLIDEIWNPDLVKVGTMS